MTLTVSPQAEKKLNVVAREEGIDPSEFVERLILAYRNEDWLAPQVAAAPSPNNGVLGDSSDGTLMVDEENLKLIKLLDTWSQEDATDDPDELDRRD